MTDERKKRFVKKQPVDFNTISLANGILEGDRSSLAKGITLIESRHPGHAKQARELIHHVLPHTGTSLRLGITGVPGAGKSTWIETFGGLMTDRGHKIAVLAIDPSSTLSGGSILGDKTRMEKLAHHPDVFIRPSPTAGTLGGVHRMTRESLLLCEAAGFDLIIVETVGVGQSESIVRGMVDFFLLLALTGAGDELQGMKRGIMELVDAIAVNKADGHNRENARLAAREFSQLLHYLPSPTPGWTPRSMPCSAVTGEGMEDIVKMLDAYRETVQNGQLLQRRRQQETEWLNQLILDRLQAQFYAQPGRLQHYSELKERVMSGETSPIDAVNQLFDAKKGPVSNE